MNRKGLKIVCVNKATGKTFFPIAVRFDVVCGVEPGKGCGLVSENFKKGRMTKHDGRFSAVQEEGGKLLFIGVDAEIQSVEII